MSDMVTTISDAANDATTIGGGGAQEGSEKGEGQHSEQSATQVHDPQHRIADTRTIPTIFWLACELIHFLP